MNKKSSKGISLISLIITIIVIIILAAIVIFSGMGTPEKAQLSAVISDIDNVQTAVDQAYYGLYTEKSVAGEVWTKSQFYEAVATGETDRENLTGTGIVPISKDAMVKMSLPNYEGRKWGVAVEDVDENTQVGSVVLYPGFETNGKIYSTLLDVQNDGRSEQIAEGIKPEVIKIADMVKVGDYVEYVPDNSTYTTDTNNTGWTSAQTLSTEQKDWRVLYVNSETGEVLLATNGIVNDDTFLQGIKGYFRGPTELNNICKELYSNSALGITARSMTIEDSNKACNYTPSEPTTRYAYYPIGTTFADGDTTIEYNGNTYTKTAYRSSTAKFYTSDGGGIEKTDSDGFIYREPQTDKPVYITETRYYYNPSSKNSTVGNILGTNFSWLASTCVVPNIYLTYFEMYLIRSDRTFEGNLGYTSSGNLGAGRSGVRPVVSLGSKLKIDTSDTTRDGSTSAKAWKIIKK